jgi:hypothetical protein
MNHHGFGDSARRFIDALRERGPGAQVKSTGGTNTIVYVASVKMGGQHIPTRSRTLHASAARFYEFNDKVKEYYASIHTLTVETRDEAGKIRNRAQHMLQFLVLDDQPHIADWREESDLLLLERKDSDRSIKVGRFFRDQEGCWHDRDAEAFCTTLGLQHRLMTSRDLPRRFLENMRVLQDYFDPRAPVLAAETRDRIVALVASGSVTFRGALDAGIDADSLLGAIAQQVVYVDLTTDDLRDTEFLHLHRDQGSRAVFELLREQAHSQEPLPLPGLGMLSPGAKLEYGRKEWELVLSSSGESAEALFASRDGHQMTLPLEEAERLCMSQATQEERNRLLERTGRRRLADLSDKALKKAAAKLEAVRSGGGSFSRSTLGKARRIVDHAASTLEALIELAGRDADKGSRASRLSPRVEQLAVDIIKRHHNTPTSPSALQTYNRFVVACASEGQPPMSYVSFLRRVNQHISIRKRNGKRVEYRDADIPLILDIREPVHGIFPHEVLYIDHTEFPVMTSGPQGQDWGKAWCSLGVDGNVPRARAFYLAYEPPSAKSVLMLLRDHVRRHRRLPRVIVVDGGKEFRTAAFIFFCRLFQISIRYRSAGRPRGGAPVERMFGVAQEELIAGLEGNSLQLAEARMTTRSVQPNQFRKWTFPQLYRSLDHYLFVDRPNNVHPALGMTPAQFEEHRIAETGRRSHMTVEFDENLLLLTCPSPLRSRHKIYPQRGIWECGRMYWHADFSGLGGKQCEVRIEPWCANVRYAHTGRRWVTAVVRSVEPFQGRTHYEVELARREAARFNRLAAERDRRTPQRARRMVELLEPLNFDETVAQKQQVMMSVYGGLSMTYAMTLPPEVGGLPAMVRDASPNISQTFAETARLKLDRPTKSEEESVDESDWTDEETAHI